MVFPTFLFSIGVALALSFPRPWRTAADRRLFWVRALRRAALLIVLGLVLEATYNWSLPYIGGTFGKPGLAYLRIPGILQRIALCYLLAAATLLGRIYDLPIIASDGDRLPPRGWLDKQALWMLGDAHLAATACAVLFVAVIALLLAPLHRRAFHFRL